MNIFSLEDVYERKVSPSMREKRRLDVALQIKSVDETGRFAGYASVFDVVDSQRDLVERGAFVQTLKDRVGEIKLLWQHQMNEPIGYFTDMFEDAYGLYVEGQLLLEVARAKEALSLMKNGVLKGLSIGYAPRHYTLDADTGVRHLRAVDLYEVSVVTFPANEVAQISVVKTHTPYDEMMTQEMQDLQDALKRMQGSLC